LSGWVFFRAPDLDSALAYLAAMFGKSGDASSSAVLGAVLHSPAGLVQLAACAAVAWFLPNSGRFLQRVTGGKVALGLILLAVSVRVMALQGFNPFLYFQF
jgi:alginate O-acetyltransferase complex protein AlgI